MAATIFTDVKSPVLTRLVENIAAMKLETIPAGQLVETKGYYEAGDGGGGRYLIKDTATVDGYVDHELAGGTFAVLQYEGALNVKQAGAVGDCDGHTGADNTLVFRAALAFVATKTEQLYIPTGMYLISEGLRVPDAAANILGDGRNRSVLVYIPTTSTTDYAMGADGDIYNGSFKSFGIQGEQGTTTAYLFNASNIKYSEFYDIRLSNGFVGLLLTHMWGNSFTRMLIQTGNGSATPATASIGIYFKMTTDGSDVVNLVTFTDCEISQNWFGVYHEGSGYNISFTGCGVEGNKYGVVFYGAGGCSNFSFGDTYFESNELGHVRINKGGQAGELRGVCFNKSTVHLNATAPAGFIEIHTINGTVELLVENTVYNSHNYVAGAASFFVEAGAMSASPIFVTYNNNVLNDSGVAAELSGINYGTLNCANITCDQPFQLSYETNVTTGIDFAPYDTKAPLSLMLNQGVATLMGSFAETTNTYAGTLSVAKIPISARPLFDFSFLGNVVAASGSSMTPVSMEIVSDALRVVNLTNKKVYIQCSYPLGTRYN